MQEDKNEILEDERGRVYELGYLLVPIISAEDLPIHYGDLKELVISFGGVVISDEMPKMIPLAYNMLKVVANVRNKFNTAYFGWIKFTMETDKILELKKKLDLDPSIVRFLILKTVKENTIATKRFVHGEGYRKVTSQKKHRDNGPVVPINKEEIDKEIDALIAV